MNICLQKKIYEADINENYFHVERFLYVAPVKLGPPG